MSEIHPATPLGSPRSPRPGELIPAAPLSLPVTVTPGQPPTAYVGVAPELAAAMQETSLVREKLADLCREFGPSPQSGWSARISLTVLNRYRDTAGLDRMSRTPSNNGEDTMLRYRRERDEAREQLTAAAGRERMAALALGEEITELRAEAGRLKQRNADLTQALADAAGYISRLEGELEAALKQATSQPDDTQYAVVELMGHVTLIGRVTEATLAGAPVLRIDRMDGRVQRVSPQALYRFTDVSEDEARAAWTAMTRWGGNLALPTALAQARPAVLPDDEDSPSPWADNDETPDRVRDDHEHGEEGHDDSDVDPF